MTHALGEHQKQPPNGPNNSSITPRKIALVQIRATRARSRGAVTSGVEQRLCNSFFLRRSPLFLCRKTSDFIGFYPLSTIGRTGRFGRTKRYYQVQKQAQLITVCSRIALVEF